MEECNQIFSIILCVRQECISLSRPLFSVHLHVTIRFHIHISLSFFMTFCSVFVLCKEKPRFTMHVLQSNPSNTIYERIEGKKQQIVFFVVFIISLIANARICNLHVVQNIHFDRAKNSELVCFFFSTSPVHSSLNTSEPQKQQTVKLHILLQIIGLRIQAAKKEPDQDRE